MSNPVMRPPRVFHACLPMYDWPEASASWDALWHLLRDKLSAAGIAVEDELRRGQDIEALWVDQDLLFGQTCGWPFVSRLREKVHPFARFDFALGGQPGDYHSVFIGMEEGDPAALLADPACTIAVNGTDSQSGWRAMAELAPGPRELMPDRLLVTGSHRNSICAVAEGRARFAAIDAASWRLALRHEPAAQQVAVLGRSMPVPGLPLICAKGLSGYAPLLFDLASASIEGLAIDHREALGLSGIVAAESDDYRVLEETPFGRIAIAD